MNLDDEDEGRRRGLLLYFAPVFPLLCSNRRALDSLSLAGDSLSLSLSPSLLLLSLLLSFCLS